MPDVSTPAWVFADTQPGQSKGTNETMPRFGGRTNPGETVHISVDGEATTIAPTPDGTWTYTVPELANGDHEFEMWAEDAQGSKSDAIEWEDNVQAGAQDRAWQRDRNRQWDESGARDFLDQNDRIARGEQPLTPPRPITGGGGSAPQPMTDPAPPTDGGRTPTGGGGSGSGQQSGGGGGQPAGLEKGNAGTVGRIG